MRGFSANWEDKRESLLKLFGILSVVYFRILMTLRNSEYFDFRRCLLHLRRRKGYSHICWHCRYFLLEFSVRWNSRPAILRRGARCYCWRKPYFLLMWSKKEKQHEPAVIYRSFIAWTQITERCNIWHTIDVSSARSWFKRLRQYYLFRGICDWSLYRHSRDLSLKVLTMGKSNLCHAVLAKRVF